MRRKEMLKKCIEMVKDFEDRELLIMFDQASMKMILDGLETSIKIQDTISELLNQTCSAINNVKRQNELCVDKKGNQISYEGTREYAQGYYQGRLETYQTIMELLNDTFDIEEEERFYKEIYERAVTKSLEVNESKELKLSVINNKITNFEITKDINMERKDNNDR